MQLLLRVSRV